MLQLLHRAEIDLDPLSIVRTHRLGKFRKGASTPIIIRFHHYKDKMFILKSSRQIQESCSVELRITEDFPKEVLDNRKILLPIYDTARKMCPANTKVNLVADKLFIGGKSFDVNNLDELPDELSPHSASTPTDGQTVAFFTKNSQFSNHHPCWFEIDGIRYTSGEQWLMAQKADLFDDRASKAQIMAATDPVEIKALGKEIKDFNHNIWEEKAQSIMETGLDAEFKQNHDLADTLIKMGTKHTIEASKDPFWGIGLDLRSESLFNPQMWTGTNTLGKALMTVRSRLVELNKYMHDDDDDQSENNTHL